jgi:hypothetical protein
MIDNILTIEKHAMERWRNGDPLGFVEISDQDLIYIDPGLVKPILGLNEFSSSMKQLAGKIHYEGSEFINPQVVIIGDAAVLSYNYCSSVISSKQKVASETRWSATEVYFRRADQWRIVHTHWSYNPEKLPESLEIPVPVLVPRLQDKGILEELMQLEKGAMERWRKGDPSGFIEISAPQVTYFDTGTIQRINGLEALKAEYSQRAGKIYFDVMDFITPQVQINGDLAVLSYRFLSTWLDSDGSVSDRIPWNCSEVYGKIESRWKILHTHWSYIKGEKI